MYGILLRFRVYPITILADIEKAFLQIGVQEHDRDVTRFLWYTDPTKPEKMKGIYLSINFIVSHLALYVVPFYCITREKDHVLQNSLIIIFMWIIFVLESTPLKKLYIFIEKLRIYLKRLQ